MARVESTDYRRGEQGGEFFYDYSTGNDPVAPPGIRKKTSAPSTTAAAAGPPFAPSFPCPLGMTLPTTLSDHRIIEKTAQFIRKTGAQSEIVLKVKQADNQAFFFLNHDHPLNPYYEFLKTSGASHQEVAPPPPPPTTAPVPSQLGGQKHNTSQRVNTGFSSLSLHSHHPPPWLQSRLPRFVCGTGLPLSHTWATVARPFLPSRAGLAALSSYDDSDDDEAAEPSTTPAPASPAPLPWAQDPAPWHVSPADPSPWQPASVPEDSPVPWSSPADEQPWHATTPPPAAPLPWETVANDQEQKADLAHAPLVGPPRPWASSAATTDAVPWGQGQGQAIWPMPIPSAAPWTGSSVARPALAAASAGPPLPIMIPRCPLPLPLPEVKEVIDKLVPFVVKNGPTFALMVRDKKAHDPLFQFFDPWHQHHAYYQWAIIAERIRQRDSLQAGGAALVAPLATQPQQPVVSASPLTAQPSLPAVASTQPAAEERSRSPDNSRTLKRILSRLPRGVVDGSRSRSRSRGRRKRSRSGDRRKGSGSRSPSPVKQRSRSKEGEERSRKEGEERSSRKRRSRSTGKETKKKRRKRSRSLVKEELPAPPPPPPQPVPQGGPGETDNEDKAAKRQRALEALRAKRTAQAAASEAGSNPAVEQAKLDQIL